LARLEDTVEQAAAIGGLFGLIGPLIQALGDMISEGGAGLSDYGLSSVATVSSEIGQGFDYLAQVGPVVQTFLIEPADFEDLLARLLDLADRILGLRTDAQPQEDAA
ncbi:MAG: hypothetical protein KC457_27825, partial [Myxococcales bacterium]|nr:hypothetical protein [Myxococcales bacterium]